MSSKGTISKTVWKRITHFLSKLSFNQKVPLKLSSVYINWADQRHPDVEVPTTLPLTLEDVDLKHTSKLCPMTLISWNEGLLNEESIALMSLGSLFLVLQDGIKGLSVTPIKPCPSFLKRKDSSYLHPNLLEHLTIHYSFHFVTFLSIFLNIKHLIKLFE